MAEAEPTAVGPAQQSRGVLGPWGNSEAQTSIPPVDDHSCLWTSPALSGPSCCLSSQHALLSHIPQLPSQPSLAASSSLAGYSLGVLKVSRFLSMVATIKDPHLSATSWPFRSTTVWSGFAQILLLQFLSTGRDFRPTCHNVPIFIMEKSPTKNWLQSRCSCLDGGGGVGSWPQQFLQGSDWGTGAAQL